MEFKVGETYKFNNPGTTKTTDRTITRIEEGAIFWKVPKSKGEFSADLKFFEAQFEKEGVKED